VLASTGVPSQNDLKAVIPGEERLKRGPVAIIECFQKIPCNPCYLACRFGAIRKFEDINDLPRIDAERCNGCGICVVNCPGLAIFIVDYTYSDSEGLVKIPYEYLPLPQVGSEVLALDREGKAVGTARVIKIQRVKSQERTPIISLAVAKDLVMTLRNIRVTGGSDRKRTIVCRCEDIDLEEIRELIRQGFTSIDEIKRISRCGMGLCQGRGCRQVVAREIARATGKTLEQVQMPTFRQPVRPLKLGKLLGGENEDA